MTNETYMVEEIEIYELPPLYALKNEQGVYCPCCHKNTAHYECGEYNDVYRLVCDVCGLYEFERIPSSISAHMPEFNRYLGTKKVKRVWMSDEYAAYKKAQLGLDKLFGNDKTPENAKDERKNGGCRVIKVNRRPQRGLTD